jgi:hypothetical protein
VTGRDAEDERGRDEDKVDCGKRPEADVLEAHRWNIGIAAPFS